MSNKNANVPVSSTSLLNVVSGDDDCGRQRVGLKPTGEELEVLPDAAAHYWVHSNLIMVVKITTLAVMDS